LKRKSTEKAKQRTDTFDKRDIWPLEGNLVVFAV